MSLFKERSVNAKKLINLENTILSLKKQLSEANNMLTVAKNLASSEEEILRITEENKALKAEVILLKKMLEEVSKSETSTQDSKKARNKRKASPEDESDV